MSGLPTSGPRGGGRGSRSPRAPTLQGEKGAQQEWDPRRALRGPLPARRGSPTGRRAGRQGPERSANTLPGPGLRGKGTPGPRSFSAPPPPHGFQEGLGRGGSHSPISILVVDIEPLRGAKELWGSEQRCQGACTHPDPGSLLPTTWLPLTSRSAEKHLSHGLPSCLVPVGPPPQPISWRVLIARSCRSSGLASLGPQPHLFIVEGGGDGPPPSPGLLCPQRTGPRASAWLAFLPEWAEERVSLFHGPRGLREKREGPEA